MEDAMLQSPLSIVTAVVLGGIFLIWALQLYSQYSRPSSKPDAVLPKGSLGWPIIGESLEYLHDCRAFSHSHVKRYGSVFKTYLFLRQVIVGTTPEFAKFVSSNSKLFRKKLPKHVMEVLGPRSYAWYDGPRHISVKKLVLRAIRAEALKNHVDAFETIILDNLTLWEHSTATVVAKDVTKKLTWDTSNWVFFGNSLLGNIPEELKNFENSKQLMRAVVSIPLKLPGTTFSTGLKAKTALVAEFKKHMKQIAGLKTNQSLFFEALFAARDNPEEREELKEVDDDALAENILLLIFTSYEITAATLIWILKLLVDYPDVFRRVQAEQEDILKSKDPSVKGPRLTWEDTRNMVYTQKFYQEVQRYISLGPFSVKEAAEDVKFEGHLIPKGWIVCTMLKYIHSDPANYSDLSFNPDRFNVPPKSFTYLPYGSGAHTCPGIELAKLTSLIFIHHVTTTYTFESAAPDTGVEYEGLFPYPKGGYPFQFLRRN